MLIDDLLLQVLGKIPDVTLFNIFLNGHWHKDIVMIIIKMKTNDCRKRLENCPAIQLPP